MRNNEALVPRFSQQESPAIVGYQKGSPKPVVGSDMKFTDQRGTNFSIQNIFDLRPDRILVSPIQCLDQMNFLYRVVFEKVWERVAAPSTARPEVDIVLMDDDLGLQDCICPLRAE
ncbi:MAG TPA: hypothetical protein VJT81_02660 [Burkholderiales bacterium]|nr:hypothetical protein [Burkholderiales bacterium]